MNWPVPLPIFSDLPHLFFSGGESYPQGFGIVHGYGQPTWFLGGAEALTFVCKRTGELNSQLPFVWVPAYFCGQSLRYLRTFGVNFVFYPVSDHLEPDWQRLDEMSESSRVDVFVLVHYFGRVSAQKAARSFCDRTDAVLVEDCAHVIWPESVPVWLGDYLFFSPHKHFPIPQGGALYSKEQFNFTQEVDPFPWMWLIRRLMRRYLLRGMRKVNVEGWRVIWSEGGERACDRTPSKNVMSLFQSKITKIDQIISKVRDNAKQLLQLLDSVEGWCPVIPYHVDSFTPYMIGMRCNSEAIAKRRYLRLINGKCLVKMWPDLPVEIKPDISGAWADVINRTRETIFFVIHDQLDFHEIMRQVENVLSGDNF